MFLLSTALRNVRRHWRTSALYLIICTIVALTLGVYVDNIAKTQAQLAQLPSAMPVSGRIVNITASQVVGLEIEERVVEGIRISPHVEGLRLTVLFRGETDGGMDVPIMGMNDVAALEGVAITWLDGYDENIFKGEEMVCVADAYLMEAGGWAMGEDIPLDLYYYSYTNRYKVDFLPLESVGIRIVGQAQLIGLPSEGETPLILLPFDTGQASHHRMGIPFTADSASFEVVDPLLLNEFKTEMKGLRLTSVSPAGDAISNKGTALLVNDATFISAADRLRESLGLLTSFLPLLVVALAAIGYFVSYLMIQNRREEYAILRLLGLNRARSMGLYFIEIAIVTLCGGLMGVGLALALGIGSLGVGLIILALFSLCFFAGSLIALWRLGRTNVMLALTQSD